MNKQKKLKSIWNRIPEEIGHLVVTIDSQSFYYRRLCFCKDNGNIEIFDVSTDIYRPLNDNEIDELYKTNFSDFADNLFKINTMLSIQQNRYKFHLAIAKKNIKEKEYYYKRVLKNIINLKNFFVTNKK